jgi:hypothetical protein
MIETFQYDASDCASEPPPPKNTPGNLFCKVTNGAGNDLATRAPRLRSISGLIRVERPLSGFRLLNQLFEAEQSGLVRK